MVERYKYKCIDAYEEPENPRTVEKILKDKMLNDIEIVIINKNLNDRGYGG